ncbi:MAG: hypothetical protein N3B68_03995 [Anaerolineae bacterium]|nr:hypothetical protein [Anaerolineae bacterium]
MLPILYSPGATVSAPAVDTLPHPRLYAPCLKDRGFIYAPNPVPVQKPVAVGHLYSLLAFLPEAETEAAPPWVVFLDVQRVATDQSATRVAQKQVSQWLSAQAAHSAPILRPDAAPFGPPPARCSPRSLLVPLRETRRAPAQPAPALSARSGRRDHLSSAQTLIGASCRSVPQPGDQRPGEAFRPPISIGLPFRPHPVADLRALLPSDRPCCRQRTTFILWRPNMELG